MTGLDNERTREGESKRRMKLALSSERGQILILTGLMAIVLFGITGLAIDIGRLYATKAELSRSVDAAALAGVLELPSIPNATAKVNTYMAENDPDATVSTPVSPGDNQLRVTATKSVNMYFLSVLGIHTWSVNAKATAGFGIQPVDAVLVLDSTSSMGECSDDPPTGSGDSTPDSCPDGSSCTTQSGCPIKEARDAAISFVNTLIGATPSGYTKVGATPFRGCYAKSTAQVDYPKDYESWPNCVRNTLVTGLTTNKTTLTNGINLITAQGGSGTNLCTGLKKGQDILFGTGSQTGSNTRHFLIVLSDGDANYNAGYANQSSPFLSPQTPCRPTSPSTSGSSNCPSVTPQTQEKALDVLARNHANTLKTTQNVEIYVVAFGLCLTSSSPSATLCTTTEYNNIGNNDYDQVADQRLLKCIASSKPGTNDHFFWASNANALPAIFTTIAQQIAHRLIE